eukprot:scaffold74438_cov21-Tisochrysis_lutea.AAC.1
MSTKNTLAISEHLDWHLRHAYCPEEGGTLMEVQKLPYSHNTVTKGFNSWEWEFETLPDAEERQQQKHRLSNPFFNSSSSHACTCTHRGT